MLWFHFLEDALVIFLQASRENSLDCPDLGVLIVAAAVGGLVPYSSYRVLQEA